MNTLSTEAIQRLAPATGYLPWFAAAAVSVAFLATPDQASAAVLVTKDKVQNREGSLTGGSRFTPAGGGRSGSANDTALDFGAGGSGPVIVRDVAFLNTAAAADEISFAFWTRKYDIAASSAFWAMSPSSNNGERGFQAHVPWSDSVIYYDTAGCCNANQRINANISTFPGYTGDVSWWQEWHYFVFSKKGESKQIWIDGALFLEALGAAPLPQDFRQLMIGSDNAGAGLYHGVVDDFAVFSRQLSDIEIGELYNGASAGSFPAEAGLLAFWDFNDPPVEGQFITVTPADRDVAAAPNLIRVVHVDGAVAWEQGNVSLKVDNAAVVPTFSKDGATATLTYVPSPAWVAQSEHTAALTYPVPGGTATMEWSFVVGPYSLDTVAGRIGLMTRGSGFTSTAGGRSGLIGDHAVDFGLVGTGPVVINDASFLNDAAAADEITFGFWSKKYDTANGSAFWALSPSSNNGQRGFQAHLPWSDNNIYYDTAGCCGANQRLAANISTFPPYAEVNDRIWWNDWHYYVFSKKLDHKQIWIDGQLFLEGFGASPLPLDFNRLMIGSDNAGGGLYHGLIDDFAVFSTQLTEPDIMSLASGAAPASLPAETGLLALWNFDDFPAEGFFLSFSPAPGALQGAANLIRVVHQQGSAAWDLNKVSVKLDGSVVPSTAVADQGRVTVTVVPSPLLAQNSSHTVELTYPGPGATLLTRTWQFTVGSYSLDVLHGYYGGLEGGAAFTPDGGGRSASPGDFGVDLGQTQTRQGVHITDASFLNEASANDEIAVGGWQKLYAIHDSAFFWGVSPSSNGSRRGIGTHAPWSNNNLYFDTGGCCAADQRTTAAITAFPPYMEVNDVSWWNDWHYVLFQKKLDVKEIWIDGQLFTTGSNTRPLPLDFTEAYIGLDPVDANAGMQGIVDDVAVFKTALSESDIIDLANGALPTQLPESVGLIAYWNFNGGQPGLRLSIVRNGNLVDLSWTGGTAPYTVQRKANLSDASWETVVTTPLLNASATIQGTTGFFRVISE